MDNRKIILLKDYKKEVLKINGRLCKSIYWRKN